jgi:UDP-N-acetylmuramyl pentapeptide phosphotransferase/UDP-N-acetylglucosamine-1-phosphate transferase
MSTYSFADLLPHRDDRMKKSPNPERLLEAWGIFFLLGVVMLNYPFIHIYNKATTLFGIPELVLYLLVGWPISILVIYFFSRHMGTGPNGLSDDDDKGRE